MCVARLKRANSLGCRGRLNAVFVRRVWGNREESEETNISLTVTSRFSPCLLRPDGFSQTFTGGNSRLKMLLCTRGGTRGTDGAEANASGPGNGVLSAYQAESQETLAAEGLKGDVAGSQDFCGSAHAGLVQTRF